MHPVKIFYFIHQNEMLHSLKSYVSLFDIDFIDL
jgi:hypothetical protein